MRGPVLSGEPFFGMPGLVVDSLPDSFGNKVIEQWLASRGKSIKDFTAMRDREDTGRYKVFYGIDNNDYSFVDIIIDVNDKTPEEIVNIILDKLVEKGLITL